MEIAEIYYKAKDGRIFTDPLKCEDYEKTLGIVPGSVGQLVSELEKLDQNYYIFGIILIKDGDKQIIFTRHTACVDYLLEDYVNIDNLTQEQRYDTAQIGELVKALKKENQDLPCQFFIIFSENIDLRRPGMMANHNPKAWNKDE